MVWTTYSMPEIILSYCSPHGTWFRAFASSNCSLSFSKAAIFIRIIFHCGMRSLQVDAVHEYLYVAFSY